MRLIISIVLWLIWLLWFIYVNSYRENSEISAITVNDSILWLQEFKDFYEIQINSDKLWNMMNTTIWYKFESFVEKRRWYEYSFVIKFWWRGLWTIAELLDSKWNVEFDKLWNINKFDVIFWSSSVTWRTDNLNRLNVSYRDASWKENMITINKDKFNFDFLFNRLLLDENIPVWESFKISISKPIFMSSSFSMSDVKVTRTSKDEYELEQTVWWMNIKLNLIYKDWKLIERKSPYVKFLLVEDEERISKITSKFDKRPQNSTQESEIESGTEWYNYDYGDVDNTINTDDDNDTETNDLDEEIKDSYSEIIKQTEQIEKEVEEMKSKQFNRCNLLRW